MDTDSILEVIAGCAREVVPELAGHVFGRQDRLVELGANSLDRAEILMMVMERLSLSIPRIELAGPSNIGELADLLHAKLSS